LSKPALLAIRVILTAAVTFAVALVTAVVLGVFDLYLTGHSLPSIGQTWIEIPRAGIYLAPNDLMLLASTSVAAGLTWITTGLILTGW